MNDSDDLLNGPGVFLRFLVTGEASNGSLAIVEQEIAGGQQTPWHRQPDDDECWYVLEGELAFWVGDPTAEPIIVGAGQTLLAPRGVPHAYEVRSATVRFLTIHTPSTHEGFYRAAFDPTTSTEVPPPGPPDIERLVQAGARFGAEILGPPPPAMAS